MLLFAVGDGNHSLATAKECYERQKKLTPREQWDSLPARYALCELVNLHDASLEFEPIHRVVFGVEPEQVTPLMRRHAKAVNFGIVYGISEFSLADDIGVTRKEARQYIDNYLAHYAGVRTYMHDIVEQAKQDGYVTTLFGRRRELPELKSSNFNIRS